MRNHNFFSLPWLNLESYSWINPFQLEEKISFFKIEIICKDIFKIELKNIDRYEDLPPFYYGKVYYPDGTRQWFKRGSSYHPTEPAYRSPWGLQAFCQNEKKKSYPHRENGPAIISPGEGMEWRQNGFLHRLDGAAVELENGAKYWYQDGKLHRVGKPAIIEFDGTKKWYQDGKLHRLDGAAIEQKDGKKSYWILDQNLTKEQFQIFQYLWENTFLKQTEKLMENFVGLAVAK